MAKREVKIGLKNDGYHMKLPQEFYLREDVVEIARDLLGKVLVTKINGIRTSGIITETEAYAGKEDRASHAYDGRLTSRTEVMFRQGGIAYVYLCYGIHSLFNVVTNKSGSPHAILIRGIQALEGVPAILKRIGKPTYQPNYTNGPGKVSKALGIHFSHSGEDLQGPRIWLEDRGIQVTKQNIEVSPRIGVDYAAEDALLPYRFLMRYT